MELVKSDFYQHTIDRFECNLGELFFFNNAVVVEKHEGVHVDSKSVQEIIHIIRSFYGNQPFCYISNRIFPYSIDPMSYPEFFNELDGLKLYCVIHHHHFDKLGYEVEKMFGNKPMISCNDLDTAFKKCNEILKEEINTIKIV